MKDRMSASLSVNTTSGKTDIQNIIHPLNIIPIDGNVTLQVVMTDKGEPGAMDSIGITLWSKDGGLWFARSYLKNSCFDYRVAIY